MTVTDNAADRECPSPETVLAFAMNRDPGGIPPSGEPHIATCKTCQQLIAETEETRSQLQQEADLPVRDLTTDIMAKLPDHAWQASSRRLTTRRLIYWQKPLRIAAALAILLGAAYFLQRIGHEKNSFQHPTDPLSLAVSAGQHWLLGSQLASGGWDTVTLGGRDEYSEALNGLTMMAIISASDTQNANTLAALERAADYLLAQQSMDGLITHSANAAMYNHGIATLALLEVDRLTQSTKFKTSIDKALAAICNHQSPAGGWGYREDARSAPNTSITVWQIKALLQARAQGYNVPVSVLSKSLNWLAGTVGPQGYFGYQGPHMQEGAPTDMSIMGAYCLLAAQDADLMNDPRLADAIKKSVKKAAHETPTDYHQAYFLASVMEHVDHNPGMIDIAALRQDLLARQVRSGREAGCWQTTGDRWGTTGGKLYSTSMAMLVLAP